MGPLEMARAAFGRFASLHAEKLFLDPVRIERRAIQNHERPLGPARLRMDLPRDDFLTFRHGADEPTKYG